MDELYLSGYDWAERYGFRIADPDGWRFSHRFPLGPDSDGSWDLNYASMLDHISEREFWLRVSVSTVDGMTIKASERLFEMSENHKPARRLKVPEQAREGLSERLESLVGKWESDLMTYPVEGAVEAKYAAATLRLCIEELKQAIIG